MSLRQICAQYLLMRGGGGPSHTSFLNMSWLEQTLWKICHGTLLNIAELMKFHIFAKHRKNCECCPVSLLIVRSKKDCHDFRFSIVRIVFSVSNVTSLWDCLCHCHLVGQVISPYHPQRPHQMSQKVTSQGYPLSNFQKL